MSSSMLSRFTRRILDRAIDRIRITNNDSALFDLAVRRARESSLDYAERAMESALVFTGKIDLWNYAVGKAHLEGICAEFGVFSGVSINHFATKLPIVYGFDSFEGLKEDWTGWSCPKGTFDLHGKLPKVAPNVQLVKGWFDETVPGFLADHPGPFSFVHIDCDTYEATAIVLDLIGARLVPGTVLIFDEYFGYRGWQVGEFKAWSDFVQQTGAKYEYLAFSTQQVAVKLLQIHGS